MSDHHLYVHTPQPIFKARVNVPGAITYPLTSLIFDSVTLGAYTAIQADQTLLLGTADGDDDLGRVRVQNIATATAIPLGRTSQGLQDGELTVQNNAYITVWEDFRVWAKIPYIDGDGIQYKDTTVPVGTFTSTGMPPVANCGAPAAATIDSGTSLITVNFDAANSIAMTDGETIATVAWDVKDGTITVGSASTPQITVTFAAGARYVGLSVFDGNGVGHSARVLVYARDPDADTCLQNYTAEISATRAGQQLSVQLDGNATFVDGAAVLFWTGEPADAGDRTNVKFSGWHQDDRAEARGQRTGVVRRSRFGCVDVAGRLATLPGFSQSLERASTIDNWDKMSAPTMDKYIHYILFWHSTALSVADFRASGTGADYPFVIFASQGESLFAQVENEAKGLLSPHHLVCNPQGQLEVNVDPMLQDIPDRTSTVQAAFDEDGMAGITFEYSRPPRVHWLRGHALLTATDYTDVSGTPTLPTVHCIAPGEAPGQGLDERETNEGLARSQAALNSAKGHEYARINARYGTINVQPSGDDDYSLVNASSLDWVTLTLTAATAAQRGFTFATVRAQVQQIRRRYEARRTGDVITADYTLELETSGAPAVTVIPVGTTFTPPEATTPPDFGLVTGTALLAAVDLDGYVYRTSDFDTVSGSGGPTWDRVDTGITETIYTFVVDPFSPGYIAGAGDINGWVATEDAIYRLDDLFGTPAATAVHTFAVTADASAFHWRSIQASFGAFFGGGLDPWLLCISYYGDTGGHSGTWATYSLNGGVTWSDEVQISIFHDTGTPTRYNPIGVYTSPKTPGLAYTAAYIENAAPALADGFVSTDWGETWSQVSSPPADSPGEPLPAFGTWLDSDDFVWAYLGPMAQATLNASCTSTGPIEGDDPYIGIHPPADAVRMVVKVDWVNEATSTGGFGSQGSGLDVENGSGVTHTGTSNYDSADANTGPLAGTFTLEYTLSVTDWPQNRELVEVTPPGSISGTHFQLRTGADASSGHTKTTTASITVTILEIELDDATVYTPPLAGPGLIQPGHAHAGSIHLPWPNNADEGLIYYGNADFTSNRQFRLMRNDAGTAADVSPDNAGVNYGINRYLFTARTYDSDRQYAVVAGIGNETSADPDDDLHAVFYSNDTLATYSLIVGPSADTLAPAGRPAYEAALGGDDPAVIFIWGPAEYISYSSNSGAAIDSRTGNLGSFSPAGFLGIAGGPTGV